MFEAMILLCLLSDQSDCIVLEDTRGPYETIKQCNERAAKMTTETLSDPVLSNLTVNGARCDKISGLQT